MKIFLITYKLIPKMLTFTKITIAIEASVSET